MEQNPQGGTSVTTQNKLVERVKNILMNPQKEWLVINGEPANPTTITMSYLLPLTLIGVVAAFIGYGLIGVSIGFGIKVKSMELGIKIAISWAIRSIAGVYILAFIIDALAPNFGSDKNFGKSFQLAAYAATPGLVAGIFLILPSLAIIAMLAGLYGLYLLYVGLPILKKTTEDKKTNYFVVVILVAIAVNVVLYVIQNQIFPLRPSYSSLSY
jgi:hypothetical protein